MTQFWSLKCQGRAVSTPGGHLLPCVKGKETKTRSLPFFQPLAGDGAEAALRCDKSQGPEAGTLGMASFLRRCHV